MRADRSLIEVGVQYDIEPPSITTDAGRQVLKRLCKEADIELDDDEEYLMPHGARRGAGEVLVRTSGHAAAARALDNSEEVVGGYATEALAASALYIACRSNDLPRPMAEIAAASRVEKRAIGRAYREVARELDINLEPVDPRKYLPRLCSALDCSEQVRTAAAGILEIAAERGAFAGKSPMGLAAASVYLASLRCDEKKIQRDIAAVAGISVATLRTRYHELLSL
jgi:transcription initiation factor TFIIIB Brf1 subunit/transcription initiation factor TFIIB